MVSFSRFAFFIMIRLEHLDNIDIFFIDKLY